MSFALREVIKISVTVLRQCLLRMSKRVDVWRKKKREGEAEAQRKSET